MSLMGSLSPLRRSDGSCLPRSRRFRRGPLGRRRIRTGAAITATALALLGIQVSSATALNTYLDTGVGLSGSYTDAFVDNGNPFAVTIVHNGAVAATQTATFGAFLQAGPATGDTMRIEQPPGTPIESLVFNLTVDPTTCIGSTTLSGQRSDPGQQVSAVLFVPSQGGYGNYQPAQITTLSGTSYAGTLPRPLTASDALYVSEQETYTRSYGSFSYSGSLEKAIGGCPPPPPVPVVVSGPKAPKGSMSVNTKRALRAFFGKGLSVTVSVDQPGKVVTDMFLAQGKLPPKATSLQAAKKRKKKRGATLIGRGTAKVVKAGAVKVTVRATRAAKKLRRKRSLSVALLTTLTNTAKQSTTLPPKKVKLTR